MFMIVHSSAHHLLFLLITNYIKRRAETLCSDFVSHEKYEHHEEQFNSMHNYFNFKATSVEFSINILEKLPRKQETEQLSINI